MALLPCDWIDKSLLYEHAVSTPSPASDATLSSFHAHTFTLMDASAASWGLVCCPRLLHQPVGEKVL